MAHIGTNRAVFGVMMGTVSPTVRSYILNATGDAPLPRRSTLLLKQGTTARQRRVSGEARATVGWMVGGTGVASPPVIANSDDSGDAARAQAALLLS